MQLPLLIFFKLKSRKNLQQQVAEDSLPVEAQQQQSENSPTA